MNDSRWDRDGLTGKEQHRDKKVVMQDVPIQLQERLSACLNQPNFSSAFSQNALLFFLKTDLFIGQGRARRRGKERISSRLSPLSKDS